MSNIIDQTFGKGDVAVLETSLAYDGEARTNGDVTKVKINVNLAGVKVRDMLDEALSQKAVQFQRPRRSADKGGNMESREQYDQYIEDHIIANDGVLDMHYSQIGASPAKVLTPEEREAQLDALDSQLTPEQIQERIKKYKAMVGEQ